jgi:hypothetical protein
MNSMPSIRAAAIARHEQIQADLQRALLARLDTLIAPVDSFLTMATKETLRRHVRNAWPRRNQSEFAYRQDSADAEISTSGITYRCRITPLCGQHQHPSPDRFRVWHFAAYTHSHRGQREHVPACLRLVEVTRQHRRSDGHLGGYFREVAVFECGAQWRKGQQAVSALCQALNAAAQQQSTVREDA